ncbi:TPM domain-containing protein, partial [Pseudooceanicola sp. GBMRC 2024]
MRRALRLLALLAACAAAPAVAQDLPDPVCSYLNDFAGVLPPDRAEALRHELQVTRRMTGAQIDVVALPDLRHFDSGESLLQFSQRMLRDWEIGDIRRQDGILLLLIAAPLEARIELGAGYNRHWDRIARDIVRGTPLPPAGAGRVGRGLAARGAGGPA